MVQLVSNILEGASKLQECDRERNMRLCSVTLSQLRTNHKDEGVLRGKRDRQGHKRCHGLGLGLGNSQENGQSH
jgi:hypothetical protein